MKTGLARLLLVVGLVLLAWPVTTTAEEPVPREATEADPLAAASAALARTEARKSHAIARLEQEAGVVDADMKAAIEAEIAAALDARLQGVRAAFERAKAIAQEEFGYADAFDGLWKQVASDEETRQAFLHDHVMEALDAADYRAAIQAFSDGVESDLARIATEHYQAHKERVDAILREAVSEGDLLGTATQAAVEELQAGFRRLKVEQTVQDPEIGRLDVPTVVPDKLFLGIVGKLLLKGIGRAILAKAGTMVGGQLVAKIMAAPVLGPVGLLVGAGALAWDITEFRSQMAETVAGAIDRIYAETVAAELKDPALLDTLSAATVASLQQQFAADARVARTALNDFFQGIFEQAQSPGYRAFQAAQSPTAAFEALKKVSLVFQRGYLDLPFAQKYHIASTLPTAAVRAAMALNGPAFLALYRQDPAQMQALTATPEHRALLRTALQDDDPAAALRFFLAVVERLGGLSETQTAGLSLLRRHAPGLSDDSVSRPLLEIVGTHARRLDGLLRAQPGMADGVLARLADGSLSVGLFDRVLRGSTPGVHLLSLAALGPELYAERIVRPGHDDTLADFSAALGPDRALDLLSQSGVDYLAAYRSLGGGGVRAVEVLARLRAEYGGAVPEPTLATLDWVLRSVSVAPERIDRRYLESLGWIGLDSGAVPNLIAVPLAELIALIGWPVQVIALLLVLGAGLLLLLPLVRVIARGLVRQLRPAPSRALTPVSGSLKVPRR